VVSLGDLVRRVKELSTRLYNYYIPSFSINKVGVSWDWVNEKVSKLPERKYWLYLDGYFYTCALEDFRKIIEWDWTNYKKYLSEVFDCDDFGMYFKVRVALNFGINAVAYVIDYSSGHAYNVVFPLDSEPHIFEPQTDWLIKVGERNTKYYGMSSYFILI